MKYAFYVSGKSGRLFKFLKQSECSILKKIKLVISDQVLEETLEKELLIRKIDYRVLEYCKIPGQNNKEKNRVLSDFILEELEKQDIDYCFSFGGHILSGQLLEIYEWKLINFHPAILPMYPGRKAIDQAIVHGNTFLVGNTAHFIDSGVDTGPIIMQSVIPLQAFYESNNDYDVILDQQINMLRCLINVIEDSRLTVIEGKVIIRGANYSKGMIYPVLEDF